MNIARQWLLMLDKGERIQPTRLAPPYIEFHQFFWLALERRAGGKKITVSSNWENMVKRLL